MMNRFFSDHRLIHMPFIQSPVPLLSIVAGYLLIVAMGKKWMEQRKPMQIERFIIGYNFMQIIVNTIMVAMVSFAFTEYIYDRLICD